MTWQRNDFPGEAPSADDRAVVARQLGRHPRGKVAVAVRCEHGLPAVVRTRPRLDDGTPFPTLYYLTCPLAVRLVGRLEAAGRMREHEARLRDDPALAEEYRRAHERYVAQRDALERIDEPMSAGGMPGRVKCLHALVAHDLADANPVGALARAEMEPLACPAPCVEIRDGATAKVAGHPAFAKASRVSAGSET